MRRSALTLLVVAAAIATAASQPARATAAEINVVGPRGGATQTVSFASLESQFDVDAGYRIRDASGQEREEQVRGISLAKLLAVVSADTVYGGVEVLRADGSSVLIAKSQILAAGPAPVVYESGGALTFLRPSYSSTDANATDIVVAGSALTLRQTDLKPLAISVTASKTKTKTRELVRFTASASGAAAGQSYEFTWKFDDGTSATGSAASHRFAKRGTYNVLLAVRAEGADRSDSKVVRIQVGAAVKSKNDRAGNGSNDAGAAPVSGSADGDSGDGAQAATQNASKQRKRKQQPKGDAPAAELPVVRGELLAASAAASPPTAASTLAARSGQSVVTNAAGFGVSKEAAGAIGALALMAIGAAFEFGGLGAARRRLRGS